jgi:hypothetical protein
MSGASCPASRSNGVRPNSPERGRQHRNRGHASWRDEGPAAEATEGCLRAGAALIPAASTRTSPPERTFCESVNSAVARNRDEDRLRSWFPTTCLLASPRTACRSPISFRIEGAEADPLSPDCGPGATSRPTAVRLACTSMLYSNETDAA